MLRILTRAMRHQSDVEKETIECPLCLGKGELRRAEILERLGVKDFARIAQLSAEEAFRLLHARYRQDGEALWARFESELAKRVADLRTRHSEELQSAHAKINELQGSVKLHEQQGAVTEQRVRSEFDAKLHSAELEKERANRRAEDFQREVEQMRGHIGTLEAELAKVARVGRREELRFVDEARIWPGVYVSDKLAKNGDFILAFRDAGGTPVEPQILIDNKDKAAVSESDVDKLVRDAKGRSLSVAALVVHEEDQLRQIDREVRWACKDDVWVLRTTRDWLRRDLDVLKPLFERMRVHGSDFLEKNAVLASEVRHTLADIDRVERELGKAAKAIQSASGLVAKHRERLQELCDRATAPKVPPNGQGIDVVTQRVNS